MPKLVLVDAHGYLHRAYHALPPLTTSRGQPVNAIYGFLRMLFKLLREQKPDYMGICFDAKGATFRDALYPSYKATRKETDADLKNQFPLAREAVKKLGLASFELEGYEADDLIATLAKKAERDGMDTVIVTADKDILQLVNERIRVFNEPKQTTFDPAKVREKWGVNPEQIVDLFSLMGDASDNVPSIPGVGEKTAAKWIQEYGSIDRLLDSLETLPPKIRDKVRPYREQMALARDLVTLKTDVPIAISWERCRFQAVDVAQTVPFLKELEFHTLAAEWAAKGEASDQVSPPRDAVKTEYATVRNADALENLIAVLGKSRTFALDLETTGLNVRTIEIVGISVSWEEGKAAYIPVGHRYLGVPPQLPLELVLNRFKNLLGNPQNKIVGHNLKYDYAVLRAAGVETASLAFDTMIASYCLDPSRRSHGLKDLAGEILGVGMTRLEKLVDAPKGRAAAKTLAMDQVDIEKASDYACADADCTLRLARKFTGQLKEKNCEDLFYKMEMPLVPILAEMERLGVGVNVPYLEDLNRKFGEEIRAIETEAHRQAGQEFNLNSSKQLAFILFEKLNLPKNRKTKTGYSTDEEVLKALAPLHALPALLLRHRELSKLKSTYAEGLLSLLREEADSPAAGKNEDARVHTSFNQTVAATGRLSSSEPNLQNIPIRSEQGRMIRKAFVPGKNYVFLSADYSQIDLRVLAHLSQDPALCRAFREGGDVHRSTAAEVFHLAPGDVTDEQRKRAKAINFGIVYGQQAFGLSQGLGISLTEAQELIEKYFKKYSGVKDWIERTLRETREKGFVTTLAGRIRYIPEILSKNGSIRSFAERVAMNTPVQGTSADIIKMAMIDIHHAVGQNPKMDLRMLLQVHDDLLFEVPGKNLSAAAALVKNKMENALPLSIPLVADLKSGTDWAEMSVFKG